MTTRPDTLETIKSRLDQLNALARSGHLNNEQSQEYVELIRRFDSLYALKLERDDPFLLTFAK